MKKKIAWICAGSMLLIGLFMCLVLIHSYRTQQNSHAQKAQAKIIVSGYVPYTLVRQLSGNTVSVEMILPPGAEPHSFEPTPGTLVALKQTNGFIYISDDLEPWALDLAKNAGENTRLLRLADSVEQTPDPHIWMRLENMPILAENITEFLKEICPQFAKNYTQNLNRFKSDIYRLQQDFATSLKHCRYRKVVHIGHLAFENLLIPYGLQLTTLSGTSHEGEHSVKKLIGLTRDIKRQGLKAIFTENMISGRLAEVVARETDVTILPLYPIEHISKQDFENNVTYVELMRRNLDSLKRGLQCPAF